MEYLVISIPICLIIFAASFVQGTAGFGFGIVAVPLLTSFFLRPEVALPLCAATAVSQALVGVIRYRKLLNVKEILALCMYCNAGSLAGVFTLRRLTKFNPELFGVIIGIILVVIITLKLLLRVEPMESISPVWKIIALFSGGYISGLAGVGGPLIVLWVMANKWDGLKARLTLWSIFLSITLLQAVMFTILFGRDALAGIVSGIVLIPVVLAASVAGIRLGNRLDVKKFQIVVFAMIYLISIYSIIKPFVI